MSNSLPGVKCSQATDQSVSDDVRATMWDKAGIGVSLACMLHCTSLPLLVAFFPSIFGSFLNDDAFHQWLLVLILPTAGFAFAMSWRRHRRLSYLAPGLIGLALVVSAVWLGHDGPWGEWGEKLLTFAGGIALAWSHFMNILRQARS